MILIVTVFPVGVLEAVTFFSQAVLSHLSSPAQLSVLECRSVQFSYRQIHSYPVYSGYGHQQVCKPGIGTGGLLLIACARAARLNGGS